MNDGSPTLEVGFVIDTGGAFQTLQSLDDVIGTTAADAVRQFQKIENATKALDLGGATAGISAFASTTSAAFNKAEQAAERMTARLKEQAETFGMTRAAAAAWRAEQVGATSAAEALLEAESALNMLRQSERQTLVAAAQAYDMFEAAARRGAEAMREAAAATKAAELEAQAQALRSATQGYDMFDAAARRGAAAMREADAAAKSAAIEAQAQALRSATQGYDVFEAAARRASAAAADVARAEALMAGEATALRAAIDPMFAAQQRFDAELTRADQLLAAGAIAQREYDQATQHARDTLYSHAKAVAGASAAEEVAVASHSRMSASGMEMMHVVRASSDAFAAGAPPMQIFAMEMGRVAQAASMAGGGAGALGQIGAFLGGPWGIALTVAVAVLSPFVAKLFEETSAADNATEAQKRHAEAAKSLTDAVERLNGSLAAVNHTTEMGITADLNAAEASRQLEIRRRGLLDVYLREQQAKLSAARVTETAGGGSVPGSMFSIGAGQEGAAVAALADTKAALALNASRTADAQRGILSGQTKLAMLDVGAATDAATAATQRYNNALDKLQRRFQDIHGGMTKADFTAQAIALKQAEQAQLKAIADAKKKPAGETAEQRHTEALGREADAIAAQIKNLYALSEAYGTSGAAALIAEARVKAESQAIKQRGDIEAFVARQVALAVAQRVADAAKNTAAMTDQAKVQEQVTAEVAAGNVPAALANELLRDRMSDLPLLAAIEAAQTAGLVDGAKKATDALDAQRAARNKLTDDERKAALTAALANGRDHLAQLQEELRLIGATDAARVHALATLSATLEVTARGWTGPDALKWVQQQVALADGIEANREAQDAYNQSLTLTADKWDIIAQSVQAAGQEMSDAFGSSGKAIGDLATTYAHYSATRARLDAERQAAVLKYGAGSKQVEIANQKYALQTAGLQIGAYGDMIDAAKGFFKEGSAGYEALAAAEKVYRVAQFAMSLQAMVQNALETAGVVTNAAAKATAEGTAGIAKQSQLPFPFNIVAMAATGAALVAAGIAVFSGSGGGHVTDPGNTGTGTVLGDSSAQSDSIKNALDALKDVDTLTNTYAREMSASLKSIDNQIGGVAAQIVKGGADATGASVAEGFKPNAIGSVLGAIPLIGGFLSSLFGSKTEVTASGLYGGSQSLGSILYGGYNASTYSDVTKTSKFLGITTDHSYSTQYGALDSGLQNQFTLILKSFDDAIVAAAGPLGAATTDIQNKLNAFVVNIGKIDLKGLTGTEIQAKLSAVFGGAADSMADAAFPGIERFQKVGEGAFETLVRVASTVEAVTNALSLLGGAAATLGIDAKIGLADQFDSVSDMTSATDAYFQAFYTSAEQTAAKTAQMGKVFDSLGLTMPATLAAYRQLVEAQDLTTTAGQSTYATLLKLAPAFSDLQTSMEGVKSAADVLSEKQDLQRQLLELQGNTAAIRALDLAKIDASNRELQQQVWAIQDAQDAAKAAKDLSDAWTSVGDSITTEINRIRGLSTTDTSGGFATLMGQFNAATSAARGGDMDAAKSLPGLSQSLLSAAALVASSRQELARVQAQTASSLEATKAALGNRMTSSAAENASILAAAATTTQATAAPVASNDDTASEIKALRAELTAMRTDLNAGNAAIASNTGRIARKLDDVTAESGGNAVSVANAA